MSDLRQKIRERIGEQSKVQEPQGLPEPRLQEPGFQVPQVQVQVQESLPEDRAGKSLVWPTRDRSVESPYQLRPRPNPKHIKFSDSIIRVVKALSVIRLKEDKEEEEPLITQL